MNDDRVEYSEAHDLEPGKVEGGGIALILVLLVSAAVLAVGWCLVSWIL